MDDSGFENGFLRDSDSQAHAMNDLIVTDIPKEGRENATPLQRRSHRQQHRPLSQEHEEPQHRPPHLSELAQQVDGVLKRQIAGLEKRLRSALASDSSRFQPSTHAHAARTRSADAPAKRAHASPIPRARPRVSGRRPAISLRFRDGHGGATSAGALAILHKYSTRTIGATHACIYDIVTHG
jgi:hypothetical protein